MAAYHVHLRVEEVVVPQAVFDELLLDLVSVPRADHPVEGRQESVKYLRERKRGRQNGSKKDGAEEAGRGAFLSSFARAARRAANEKTGGVGARERKLAERLLPSTWLPF